MSKVFLNYQGDSVKIDGVCYYLVGTTGLPVNTEPSEVGGVFSNCLECLLESSSSESSESIGNTSSSDSSSSSGGYSSSSSSSEEYSSSSTSSEEYSSSSSSGV